MKLLLKLLLFIIAVLCMKCTPPQKSEIRVHARQISHTVSELLTGACIEDVNHEIYGGIYSQMIFGESFQEPPSAPKIKGFSTYCGRWLAKNGVIEPKDPQGFILNDTIKFQDGRAAVEMFFNEGYGERAGLLVHANKFGSDNNSFGFSGYEITLNPSARELRLQRHNPWNKAILKNNCEIPSNRWFVLEVNLTGPEINISIDKKTVLQYKDTTGFIYSGTLGLMAINRPVSFRNMKIIENDPEKIIPFIQTTEEPEISRMWKPLQRGTASGSFHLNKNHPFTGNQSQQITFISGKGEWGIENQGLNRWGMNFTAGKPYEGLIWARAEKNITLVAAIENSDGGKIYSARELNLSAGGWQKFEFLLTPSETDKKGRFTLKLKQPGSVTLGYVFLQPGNWGRFKELPVRRDVAEGLINQGITVLRYGGSMINHKNYRWKNMIGPRDRRQPYDGTWYPWSSNGWGIPDFMNFCEAAGFEYIPAFNIDESPKDMADFIEYAKAPPGSKWGSRRAADGHPMPYRLNFMELGNEERVDTVYASKFEKLATAIWAKDSGVILVVGDFMYKKIIHDPFSFEGGGSGITSLEGQQQILKLAGKYNREVWFDVHVGTEQPVKDNASMAGMLSFSDALDIIAGKVKHKVVVFEYNAGNHAIKRALANAIATLQIERDGRIPVVCSANCLQPDGQNDNDWNQGLLFLNQFQVWLQPPGYVTQMFSRNFQPFNVNCEVNPAPGAWLETNARSSKDGKTLVLEVVNPSGDSISSRIMLDGFNPASKDAVAMVLSGNTEAVNTAERTDNTVPLERKWTHGISNGKTSYTFLPNSFTILRFD